MPERLPARLTRAMLGDVEIREAQSGDLPRLGEVVDAAYSPYIARIGMRPGPMNDDLGARLEGGLIWVAADPGAAPAGLIVLIPAEDHLLIENVAVAPGRQGEGIGGQLMAFAEGRAAALGLGTIRLYTHELMTENRAIYAGLGFGEDELRREEGFARVFMSKRLG